MSGHEHTYRVRVTWTGNQGVGTRSYREYGREHTIAAAGKPDIPGSSDPAFRGNPERWSPEDLLVASVSACHKLWYLHLCADAGIVVAAYEDDAVGTMREGPEGGSFSGIVLRPRVTIGAGDPELAVRLHEVAHHRCYIANSVTFAITCEPALMVAS